MKDTGVVLQKKRASSESGRRLAESSRAAREEKGHKREGHLQACMQCQVDTVNCA